MKIQIQIQIRTKWNLLIHSNYNMITIYHIHCTMQAYVTVTVPVPVTVSQLQEQQSDLITVILLLTGVREGVRMRVGVRKGVWVGDGMRTIISDISFSISRHVLQRIPNVSLCLCTGWWGWGWPSIRPALYCMVACTAYTAYGCLSVRGLPCRGAVAA